MPQHDTRPVGGIYQVGQIISAGGPLTICTAYDRNTNDVVGLFIIEVPPSLPLSQIQHYFQSLEQRRTLSSLHVLRVHNWGIDGQRAYVATDPPRGVSLQHVMDNENIDQGRAIELIRQVATGLHMLHERGIAALDLRPQFITVDTIGINDRVQIDDIGLRPLLRTLGYINGQEGDVGYLDPLYAPPEYINAGPAGPWSDIYQAGLLLFTLLTGRLPFVGRTPAETGVMQSTNPVPRMAHFVHNVPEELQHIVEAAMEKEPARRFASARAFITALNSVQPAASQPFTDRMTPVQEARRTPPSMALTKDMPVIDDDHTLYALSLEGYADVTRRGTQELAQPEGGVYAYLRYEKKGAAVQRIPLTAKKTIIGRLDPKRGIKPDIDLSAFDPKMTVSRQHARISFEETFFYIEDLKSRNKTRLGALTLAPLKAELLQHGDTISFGSVRMRFEIAGRPPLKELEEGA
ncbi:MAG: FHA domain-containing protein [Ktedonobacteraceae bacterium]|nr:FHA domain-containing protein [Ktedonobacteraceae bacterium]